MFIAPLVLAGVVMASTPAVKITGDWTVRVPAQRIQVGRSMVEVKSASDLKLDPPATVVVHNEKHEAIPKFAPEGRWMAGALCSQIVSYGITIPGILNPDSLAVKPSPDGEPFLAGQDYKADLVWAAVGRVDGGAIGEKTAVFFDYSYKTSRVDSIAVDKHGICHIIKGDESTLCCTIPVLPKGDRRLANVFVPGYASKLTDDFLFPIRESGPFHDRSSAASIRALIPKTWAKLVGGGNVRILAWGDSVTDGLYLADKSERWQEMFVKDLREQFPNAKIDLVTEAWGGRTTSNFLAEPSGSQYNFKEKVLDAHPDLVISEFVNDVGIPEKQNIHAYSTIHQAFQAGGIEWIVMTPHYDTWQHQPTFGDKVEKDIRPHVEWLREYAAANGIGLADASLRWDHLAPRGIPYAIYLTNGINHPNRDGLHLYVDALMDAFGE